MDRTLTDGFGPWGKTDVVDTSLVAGELVQQLPTLDLPNHHRVIATTRTNLLSLGIPTGPDEVLLQARGCSIIGPDVTIGGGKGSDIPSPHGGVH